MFFIQSAKPRSGRYRRGYRSPTSQGTGISPSKHDATGRKAKSADYVVVCFYAKQQNYSCLSNPCSIVSATKTPESGTSLSLMQTLYCDW